MDTLDRVSLQTQTRRIAGETRASRV
jgi:hypothetical protein